MGRTWDWLRMTRSSPGALAKSDPARANLYRAALGQFEDLIEASRSSGPASRPLPLFYALTQAGRAIVAMRGGPDHRGHALHLGAPQNDALFTTVIPVEHSVLGHFQAVSDVTGSPRLRAPTTIVALIASLPEMSETLLLHDDWPQALAIFEREPPARVPTPGWTTVSIVIDRQGIDYAALTHLLELYPTVKGKIGVPEMIKALGTIPTYATPEGAGIGVLLQGGNAELDSAAPQHRIYGRRWLRPGVAGGTGPSPFMTWWAVLYALSMYARYFPREWVAALDIESCAGGVLLERGMDRALYALPQLVLSHVLETPFLLPATEGFGPDPFGRAPLS